MGDTPEWSFHEEDEETGAELDADDAAFPDSLTWLYQYEPLNAIC